MITHTPAADQLCLGELLRRVAEFSSTLDRCAAASVIFQEDWAVSTRYMDTDTGRRCGAGVRDAHSPGVCTGVHQ